MPMCNLTEYSDHYSKTSGSLWQYYSPSLNNVGIVIDFADNNKSVLFKFKQKLTGQTGAGSIKYVEIMVPLKCLNNFWRTIEMLLVCFEIILTLTWSVSCAI